MVDLTGPVPDKATALEFLLRDGDLHVPCSRYGGSTSECAEVAWELFQVMREHGCDDTFDALESDMSLVVNDHDDVALTLELEVCDECGRCVKATTRSRPGYTGAPIFITDLACGHQTVDVSRDNAEAAR